MEILTEEQKIQFCQNKNLDYNAKICSNLEYTMSYLTASIIEFCSLVLIFFWYNDYRRIKEKINGELPIYDNNYISREFQKDLNYNNCEEPVEPSDRYLNQNNNNLVQVDVVVVKNKNNNSHRNSQPLNLNNNKNNPNFIRDLRKEMKEAIESLDEESSNKKDNNKFDNNNKNDNKKNDSIKNDSIKNDSIKNDEDKNSSNKNSSKTNDKNSENNDNIVIINDEESKEQTNDQKMEQKDLSIFNDDNNQDVN